MSINLRIKFDGVAQELYQTPSYITKMCLMKKNGNYGTLTDHQAKRAIYCYFEYCRSLNDGAWEDQSEHLSQIAQIFDHIQVLTERMNQATKIEVYGL